MDNPNPIHYSDLITPDNSITNLISQLQALISEYDAAKSKIQTSATEMAKGMQNISGATEEQRKAIEITTQQTEKLEKEYRRIFSAQMELKSESLRLSAAKKEETQVTKLLQQLNVSAEGSYNRLSAQYRLNKIRLNEMSEAERFATDAGRKLEAETKAIYERMNELQKATGKSQLQVGQYERALGGALGVNGRFLSILTDTKKQQEALGAAMSAIKTPLGGIVTLIAGGTQALKLFKDSVNSTRDTGDNFGRGAAEWTSNIELFKKAVSQVDMSLFIRNMNDAASAARELYNALDRANQLMTSASLLRASMTEEISALEEIFRNSELSYEEREAAAREYLEKMKPIYEAEAEAAKQTRDARLKALYSTVKAEEYASDEELMAAAEVFAANLKNFSLNEELINQAYEYLQAEKDLAAAESMYQKTSGAAAKAYENEVIANRKKIASTSEAAKSLATFVEEYKLTTKEEINAYVEAERAYHEKNVAIYQDNKRVNTLLHRLAKQRTDEEKREHDKQVANAKQAAKERERAAQAQAAADKQAAADAERARQQEISDQRALYQAQLQSINLEIAVTKKGTEEMLKLRVAAIKKQEEIEIFENKQKAEHLQQDEKKIRAKYQAMILSEEGNFYDTLARREIEESAKLRNTEIDLMQANERQKTKLRIKAEIERLTKILELNKTAEVKLSDEQVEAIKNTIERLKQEAESMPYDNIWELLGIKANANQIKLLDMVKDSVLSALSSIVSSWNQVAEAAVNAAEKQVSAAQSVLDAQIEAKNKGYAADVKQAQKELELARKTQEKANKEREKAAVVQLALDSVVQAESMIVATANIWKVFSGMGPAGPALAAAMTAFMWGSFLASKIYAYQVTKQAEQYSDGTVELLEGGSHASGHDIDLGTKKDGTRRRAEGGEFFAVINKRSSRRYRRTIPDVINSLNDGTFGDKYQRASEQMSGYAVQMIGGTDVSKLEKDVSAIRKQGDEARYFDGRATIIKHKNLTRKVLS